MLFIKKLIFLFINESRQIICRSNMIEVTLEDDCTTIKTSIEKNVLKNKSKYFKSLLSAKYKESSQEEIVLKVPDAYIAYEILTNNRKNIDYALTYARTVDYWNMEFDYNLLNNLEVMDYDKLLEIADIVGLNDKMIAILNKYLPTGYDYSKIPSELLIKLVESRRLTRIVSGGYDDSIRIWDATNGEMVMNKKTKKQICSLACSPDKKYILSGNRSGHVSLYSVKNLDNIMNIQAKGYGEIKNVAFSPNNEYLSFTKDKYIYVCNISGKIIHNLTNNKGVCSVSFSPNNRYIVSGNNDNSVDVWELSLQPKLMKTFVGHSNLVSCAIFSPDMKYIASGSWDRAIIIWNFENGECIHILKGHRDDINRLSYSPDGNYLASCSSDDTIKILDTKQGIILKTFDGHYSSVLDVVFSPNGKFIASCDDRCIMIWNVSTGEIVRQLMGHVDQVSSLCWHDYLDDIGTELNLELEKRKMSVPTKN